MLFRSKRETTKENAPRDNRPDEKFDPSPMLTVGVWRGRSPEGRCPIRFQLRRRDVETSKEYRSLEADQLPEVVDAIRVLAAGFSRAPELSKGTRGKLARLSTALEGLWDDSGEEPTDEDANGHAENGVHRIFRPRMNGLMT